MPSDRPVSDTPLRTLSWRCIGPFRGGRVVTVAGDSVDPAVFYFGACAVASLLGGCGIAPGAASVRVWQITSR
jgi:hypothetical protein